ncbi:hypothetical protein D3C78_1245260 [compost metagenome]
MPPEVPRDIGAFSRANFCEPLHQGDNLFRYHTFTAQLRGRRCDSVYWFKAVQYTCIDQAQGQRERRTQLGGIKADQAVSLKCLMYQAFTVLKLLQGVLQLFWPVQKVRAEADVLWDITGIGQLGPSQNL